ncbi:hypothetical protein V6N13_079329 [Hibiscus sabdariffa]|uniref:Uncharacterized protein n=1 Tax=Hibiscus sabdariffa TaxID=183260 RepID=A0ABR2RRD9_9ROSI
MLKFIFAILNVHGVWRCPIQPAEAPPLSCEKFDLINYTVNCAIAPCCYWSSGISNTNHCHATNKEEIWKTLRNSFRLGRNVSAPIVPSHSIVMPQLDHAPRRDIIQLTTQNHVSGPTPTHHVPRPTLVQASGNCISQNHVLRPSIIHACSASTRRWIPYNPSVGGRHVLNKSTVQPPPVSQEVLGVHNTVMRRDRGIKIRDLGSQFVSSNTISKRLDMEVSSTVNLAPYVPSENNTSARASRYQQNPASVAPSNERNPNPIGWPKNCSDTSLGTYTHQISSQPSMDCVFTNTAPSLTSANSWHVPQSNVHEDSNHIQSQNHPARLGKDRPDFDISWVDYISQNKQQPPDYLQFQTSGSTTGEGPFNINEGDNSYYNELESFLSDNHSTPEGSLTARLNAPSPPDHAFRYWSKRWLRSAQLLQRTLECQTEKQC